MKIITTLKMTWLLELLFVLQPVKNESGHYGTELFTEVAERIIDTHNKSEPLYLYFAHQAVHSGNPKDPLQAPKRMLDVSCTGYIYSRLYLYRYIYTDIYIQYTYIYSIYIQVYIYIYIYRLYILEEAFETRETLKKNIFFDIKRICNFLSRSAIQKGKVKVQNLSLFKWAQLSTMNAAILKATQ